MSTWYECVNCGLLCREREFDPEGQQVAALYEKLRGVDAAARRAGIRRAASPLRLRKNWVHLDGKLMCPNNLGCAAFPGAWTVASSAEISNE